jgi:hypothetical protein
MEYFFLCRPLLSGSLSAIIRSFVMPILLEPTPSTFHLFSRWVYFLINLVSAFYDGGTTASNAGTFLHNVVLTLKATCPGKKIMITEYVCLMGTAQPILIFDFD